MADTIVNTPDRVANESAAGWAIAAVVVVAVIIGAVLLFRNGVPGIPNTGTMDVNVELPAGSTGGTNTGGSGSGSSEGGGVDGSVNY